MMADPYVTEIYPTDGGYASLCLVCFDLLSGVLEGINSEGLVAALNADELVEAERGVEDIRQTVGLHELQALRLVLDTCATVEEAKEALLINKHRYALVPCHFTIGDRHGDSFVYDHGHGRRREHLIDGTDGPLFVTNHPLHLYPSVAGFPEKWRIADARTTSFERYKRLAEMIEETPEPYALNAIREISAAVSVSQAASWIPDEHREQFATHPASSRTLWHSIYDSDARTLEVKFYLGEQPGANGNFTEQYSEYFHFALQP